MEEQERSTSFWAKNHSEVSTGKCSRWKELASRRVTRSWEQVKTSVRETVWRQKHSTGFLMGIDLTWGVLMCDCRRCQNKPLPLHPGLERPQERTIEPGFRSTLDPFEPGSASLELWHASAHPPRVVCYSRTRHLFLCFSASLQNF